MFSYYSLAQVCYALLEDVPTRHALGLDQDHSPEYLLPAPWLLYFPAVAH